jgi:hypothetical protein
MASFEKHNGKQGIAKIYHTATGYECPAIINFDNPENAQEVIFFAKQITSLKGKPYTEIGFYAEQPFDTNSLYKKVSECLYKYGLDEVAYIENYKKNSLKFSRYNAPNPNKHLEIRLCAGDDGILIAFYTLKEFIHNDCRNFVHEQEVEVEDVLFKSIWANLGDEMCKSVGGKEYAIKHCREIADTIKKGL